jgi:nucleoid-associated protein YgaU
MSGPEWTPEPASDRFGPRPLSPDDAHGFAAARPRSPAQEPTPEPAMTQDHPLSDPDESEPDQAPARGRPGFKFAIPKFLKPSYWLGRERHEAQPQAPPASDTEGEPTTPPDQPEPHDQAETRPRPATRFPLMGLKRQTRVAIAAVLSVAVLVSTMVVKRGVVGKSLPLVINGKPSEKPGTPAATSNATEPPRPVPEPTPPVPNPLVLRDETPKPSPREAPADTPTPEFKLANETRTPDPNSPPTGEADLPPMANLVSNDPPPAAPAAAPDLPGPKPIEVPAGPTDPLPLTGDPAAAPSTDPAPTPKPEPEPTPKPVPEPTPAPDPTPAPTPAPSTPTPAPDPTPAPAPDTTAPGPLLPGDPPVSRPAPPPAPAPAPAQPEPTPEPPPSPPPAATPPPTRVEAAAPVRAARPPTLDPVPAAESAPTPGAHWVVIPSGGKRVPGIGAPPSDEPSAAPSSIRDGPRPHEDLADQFEPVLHRVQPGENFWTISRTYYHSERYYKALHAANGRQVPKIDELYVGTVLRIPPPEALDRSLILPSTNRPKVADEPTGSKITRTSRRDDPAGEVELALPTRPRPTRPDPELPDEPRRPTYTVKPNETLRSIARDTLNDPRRHREILGLNREVIEDPADLPPGTTLTLPEDAVVGRKAR